MNITTLGFLLFVAAGLCVYYILPHRFKWILLLVMSVCFYAAADCRNIVFILAFTCSSYFFANAVERVYNTGGGTEQKLAKKLVTIAIVTDLLILFLVKYFPVIFPMNEAIQGKAKFLKFFIPIGISYYTLMSVSYVLDVYWKKTKAEHNFFRLMLFTGYFPLLVQGPVCKWKELSGEFFREHKFNFRNIKFGLQLMLWGFVKKLIIADRSAKWVNGIFSSAHDLPYGFEVVAGLVFYALELYADFSGGIDIIRGVSECFDVRLIENFRQPYFSKSLGEFWRRWHISLGRWMKDYVFYPIALSKTCTKLKKTMCSFGLESKSAIKISFAAADLAVFFLVGLWHGAGSKFILWGLYNGIILAVSELLKDIYARLKKFFHINDKSLAWSGFCMLRTFAVVLAGYCFDVSANGSQAVKLFCNIFKSGPSVLNYIKSGKFGLAILVFFSLVLLFVDILNCKGISVREKLDGRHYVIQFAVWTFLLQMLFCVGIVVFEGGFMYANF